jgi:gamma-polyglutamate synthase
VLVPLIACLVVLIALGVAERLARNRAWSAIPIRIHVNGTRGKSTVTRLVWAALNEAGVPALAKTTGTAARTLLPDGREEPLRRWGPATIREQLECLRRARRLGARAVVLECMALAPALQHVSERQMVRATIGVITNVRFDHQEIMGRDLDTIASTLANTIPPGGLLVTGPGPWVRTLDVRAAALGARIVIAGGPGPEAVTPPGGDAWLSEDRTLALAVARELGIDDAVALRGFARAPLDPGTVRTGRCAVPGGDAQWLDATAANDPESLELLLEGAGEWNAGVGHAHPRSPGESPVVRRQRILLYHHRSDRASRLAAFAARSPSVARADRLVVTGARPPWTVWRRLVAARPDSPTRFVASADLPGWLRANAAGAAVAFCGNTRGLDVPHLLEEAERRD